MQISLKKARSPRTTEGGRSDQGTGGFFLYVRHYALMIFGQYSTSEKCPPRRRAMRRSTHAWPTFSAL